MLTNQATLHGYIRQLKCDTLFLCDLRGNIHQLKFNDIEEIMLDRETAY